MIKYLKSTAFSSLLLLGVLFVLLKFPIWLDGNNQSIIIKAFSPTHYYIFIENYTLSFCSAQLIILIQAIWINYLFISSSFIREKTIVPAYLFILLSSAVNSYNFINTYHIIITIFIGLYHLFLRINFKEQSKSDIFNAGCLFGIAIILLPNLILFIPFLLIIIFVIKPLQIKELLLVIIGILCIPFFYLSFVYLLEFKIVLPFNFYFYPSNISNEDISIQISIFIIALCSILSLFGMIGIKQSTENRVKRNVDMVFLLAIGLLTIILFNTYYFPDSTVFIFIPSTLFISIFLHRIKNKKMVEFLNIILLISIFITYVYKN